MEFNLALGSIATLAVLAFVAGFFWHVGTAVAGALIGALRGT